MIRRPPRSTLFPYRRSSDLDLAVAGARALAGEPRRAPGLPPVAGRQQHPGARPPGRAPDRREPQDARSEEHTSELQSRQYLVCRLLLEKKNNLSHLSVAEG